MNLPTNLIASETSKQILDLMHPDDVDHYLLEIQKHLKNETQGFVSEYRIISDEGEWRWFLQRGRGIRNDSGQVTKMYGLIQDIHHEKIESDKLKLADSRLDELMENSSNAIFIWSGERKLVKINEAGKKSFKDSFGKEAEIGLKHKDAYINGIKNNIFHPPPEEDSEEWAGRQFDERLKNAGIPFEILGKDGSWLRLLNSKRNASHSSEFIYHLLIATYSPSCSSFPLFLKTSNIPIKAYLTIILNVLKVLFNK